MTKLGEKIWVIPPDTGSIPLRLTVLKIEKFGKQFPPCLLLGSGDPATDFWWSGPVHKTRKAAFAARGKKP